MKSERDGSIWLLLAVLALTRGSSLILMKRGLTTRRCRCSPLQMATARLAIAGLALSPLLFRYAALFPDIGNRCSVPASHWARHTGPALRHGPDPHPSAERHAQQPTPLMTSLTGAPLRYACAHGACAGYLHRLLGAIWVAGVLFG
ncbi:MAG: hypothetical protein IPF41_17180 [Flavobacteriales bacterium]|nr:hypothetical protein [Flavobacteriales bacterium]